VNRSSSASAIGSSVVAITSRRKAAIQDRRTVLELCHQCKRLICHPASTIASRRARLIMAMASRSVSTSTVPFG
jgi:hypothetical protein